MAILIVALFCTYCGHAVGVRAIFLPIGFQFHFKRNFSHCLKWSWKNKWTFNVFQISLSAVGIVCLAFFSLKPYHSLWTLKLDQNDWIPDKLFCLNKRNVHFPLPTKRYYRWNGNESSSAKVERLPNKCVHEFHNKGFVSIIMYTVSTFHIDFQVKNLLVFLILDNTSSLWCCPTL